MPNIEYVCAGQRIPIYYEYRKRKKLYLEVHALKGVRLFLPLRLSWAEAERFLESRQDWILEAWQAMQVKRAELAERRAANAKVWYHLGEAYVVELVPYQPTMGTETWCLDKTRRVLKLADKTTLSEVEREAFIASQRQAAENSLALEVLPPLFEACYARFTKRFLGQAFLGLPHLSIKSTKSIWGSCRKGRRRITLNTKLCHCPEALICYVIYHELCHLIEANHSPAFYAVQAQFVADEAACRQALKSWALLF